MNKRNDTKIETTAACRFGARAWAALSATKSGLGAMAALLLASQAPAASFIFSTGAPDGKIATLTRPSCPGKLQTETADDLVVTQSVVISRATFTGLLPVGASPASVSN